MIMAIYFLTRAVVEKERKQAEKNAKFAAKKAKAAETASAAPTTSKTKEKKGKQDASREESLPDYVEETPPGQKKCTFDRSHISDGVSAIDFSSLKTARRSISQSLHTESSRVRVVFVVGETRLFRARVRGRQSEE